MAIRHASAGEIVDLTPLGADLKHARTTAIVKNERFEAVRLALHVGKDVKTHVVDGPITLHCLEGRVLIGLRSSTVELSAGQWVYFDGGLPHSLRAIEDASLLLTILFLPKDARPVVAATSSAAAADQLQDSRLDQGLKETFPASDPVSVSNPITGIGIRHRHQSDEDAD